MPELAEVAYACSQWKKGLGKKVVEIITHPTTRVYREEDRNQFAKDFLGSTISHSATHGKQMLFRFSKSRWLGLHLGMTGSLAIEDPNYLVSKYDALVLRQHKQTLVFRDPRQFGRIRVHLGKEEPTWWSDLPVSMLDPKFDIEVIKFSLLRHAKRPIKAILLDQRYFQGMGNWMADEVLWRARIHPAQLGGKIKAPSQRKLFKEISFVVKGAMSSIARHGGDPPNGWLFHVRWKDGGSCPTTGKPLVRREIGGRTSCWCPEIQKEPRN